MNFNSKLFWLLTAFYAVDAVAYTIWSLNYYNGNVEIIGTAAIGMLVFMSAFLAFYFGNTHRNSGKLPEDRLDANIEDGDAELGFFSPWSWWPFFIGGFAALAFTSLAVGWWLFFIAFPLALVALIGFVFEYSRGQHAH
jgi:hypothetical protein